MSLSLCLSRLEQMSGLGNRCHDSRAGRHRRERVVSEIWPERENRRHGAGSNSKATKRQPRSVGGEDRTPGAEDGEGVELDRTSESGRWTRLGGLVGSRVDFQDVQIQVCFLCAGDSLHSDELREIPF